MRWRASRASGALAWLFVWAAASTTHAGCPEPVVNVVFNPLEVPVVLDRSMREISVMSGDADMRTSVGLYANRFQVRMSTRVRIADPLFGDAAVCVRQVDLAIETEHAIYVAREFPRGSCAFDEALAHERKHEQIFRQQIQSLLQQIKDIAGAHLRLANGNADINEGRAAINTEQTGAIQEITRLLKLNVNLAQHAFDSPEEYARFNAACNNQISALIKDAGG